MANALGPYFVRINYHGLLAPHTMTLPTKTWNNGAGPGTFDTWAGGTIDSQDMIEGLVDTMLPFFNSSTVFDNWQIFKQLLPSDAPQPVRGDVFTSKAGTNTGGTWSSAVEGIMTARTAAFGIAKLTLLDACCEDNFAPRLNLATPRTALFNNWASDASGWCGRDNAQVQTYLKMTYNLNDALRKEYGYT